MIVMKRTFLFFTLALFIYSCQESLVDIDVDGSAPQVVVGGLFAPNEEMVVKVTRSITIQESPRFSGFDIDNATVELFEGDRLVDQLTYRSQRSEGDPDVDDLGAYYSSPDFFPDPEKTYTLVINTPDFGSVTATTTIPKTVDIETFEVGDVAFSKGSIPFVVGGRLSFTDDPFEKNYYALEILGEAIAGQWYDDDGELVTYIDSASLPLKATLPDKIDFAGEEVPFTGNVIYFSDDAFNGERYSVDLTLGLGHELGAYLTFKAQLKHITEEHYRYGTTAYLQERETAENPFSQPVQVFGNIENGLGIFAGYGKSRLEYVPDQDD